MDRRRVSRREKSATSMHKSKFRQGGEAMKRKEVSRRQFLQWSAVATGSLASGRMYDRARRGT